MIPHLWDADDLNYVKARKDEWYALLAAEDKVNGFLKDHKYQEAENAIKGFGKSEHQMNSKKYKDRLRELNTKIPIARKRYFSRQMRDLVANGNCEDALVLYRKCNPEDRESLESLKESAYTNAVRSLMDIGRLAKVFSLVDTREQRVCVARRMQDTGDWSKLPIEELVSIALKLNGDLGADINALDSSLFRAIFNCVTDRSLICEFVWTDSGNSSAKRAYVDVYGEDDAVRKFLRQKREEEISRIERDNFAEVSPIDKAFCKGRNEYPVLCSKLVLALKSISDMEERSKMVLCLMDRWSAKKEWIEFVGDTYGWDAMPGWEEAPRWRALRDFGGLLCGNDAKKAIGLSFERFCCRHFREKDLLYLYEGICAALSREDVDSMALKIRERAKETINFAGYYCGMSLSDFTVLNAHYGVVSHIEMRGTNVATWPRIGFRSGMVEWLRFDRNTRFKIEATEDDEFWEFFMAKCIPDGASRYKRGWDSEMKAMCDCFRSMKYNTRARFCHDSGSLILDKATEN